MSLPRLRPTFEIPTDRSPDDAIAQLRTLVDEIDHPVEGRIVGNHIMLVIPPADRHLWSPWLNIEVHGNDQGCAIQGRFSPNPSIWTGFMLTYIALITLGFFSLMFAIAQLIMNNSPWAFLIAIAMVLVGGILYWISIIGQRLANAQMHELHDATQRVLGNNYPATDTTPG